ncbi:hypothetical protein B1218_38840, partial [Pseudomonas ogarae]
GPELQPGNLAPRLDHGQPATGALGQGRGGHGGCERVGLAVRPEEAAELGAVGLKITRAANEQLGFVHPLNPDWSRVSFCQIAAPIVQESGIATGANAVVIQPGKIDR